MTGTILSHIERHARDSPTKVFWRHLARGETTDINFADFHRQCLAFCDVFVRSGVAAGDVVLVFLSHVPELAPGFFGAMFAGAIPSYMPCPSGKQRPEIYWPEHRALFGRLRRPFVLTDRGHRAQMEQNGLAELCAAILVIEECSGQRDGPGAGNCAVTSDMPALLQHSSGTTSLKKGVVLTHGSILLQVEAYAARLSMSPADMIVSWLPLYHDMGLVACTLLPLVMGQTVVALSPFEWVLRPQMLFEAIEMHGGTFCWLPNFAFEHLARAVRDGFAGDLSRVRAFINCSEPCKPATFDLFVSRFARNGVRIQQLQACYAMAETVFAVTQTRMEAVPAEVAAAPQALYRERRVRDAAPGSPAVRIMSTGAPLTGLDLRIETDGAALPPDHVGEIVIAGDFLFDGYHNAPVPTRKHVRNGRYHTRDRGFMRDGELYVLGRMDDLIIVNGRNLHANEIEAMLGGVAGVKPGRLVAFGVFNENAGSQDLVVVAERDGSGVDEREMVRSIRRLVYETTSIEVKHCRVVDAGWLVKTTSGKIGRSANREKYRVELPYVGNGAEPGRLERPVDVAAFIAAFFGVDAGRIGRHSTAADVAGWDSIAHTLLMLQIETAFGIRFSESEVYVLRDVGALADRVAALVTAGGGTGIERTVLRSARASVVRMGGEAAPDVIVFAGLSMRFAGLATMEFSTVFAGGLLESNAKYFVTDHGPDWYTTCFEEVALALNRVSDRPKILIGNSMGGYGAMKFATVLHNVIGVLAFVPQRTASPIVETTLGRDRIWSADFVDGTQCCVVYGGMADQEDATHFKSRARDDARHRVIEIPGRGHDLVRRLQVEGLLGDVMSCAANPDTMADAIVEMLRPAGAGAGR